MTLPIFFAKINLGAHSQIPYLQGKWQGRFSNGQKLPFLIEHELGASVVASLLMLAILSKLCWVASLQDALRALGFDRAVRKLTIRLAAGKADGTLLTRFAAATRCLCSLRSLATVFGTLDAHTRARYAHTRAHFGLAH